MQYQMLKIKKITNKEEYKKEAYEEAHKHSCPPRVTYYLAKSQAEACCLGCEQHSWGLDRRRTVRFGVG